MFTLVITVILAVAFALFATQNTHTVDINFANYVLPSVPLYLVVLASLALGLFSAFIIYIVKDLSSRLTISEQKDESKKLRSEVTELTKEVHKLELENTKLKAKAGEDEFDEDSI